MIRHPERVIKMRSIEACLCCPDIGYVCQSCALGTSQAQAVCEETAFPSESPPWDVRESPPELQGYGYRGACQDGYDGEEMVSPVEHKEREFFEAARVLLEAGEIFLEQPSGRLYKQGDEKHSR